jgi:hypothetical protein
MLLGFVLWASCIALGAIWRLIDRRPTLFADETGLFFHPSIHREPVAWNQVLDITMKGAGLSRTIGTITILLQYRFWSTWACVTSRTVKLNITDLDIRRDDAAKNISAMLELKTQVRLPATGQSRDALYNR